MNLPPDLPSPPPLTPQPDPYAPPAVAPAPPPFHPPADAPAPQSHATLHAIHQAIAQVFIGQHDVIYQVLAALLAGGHVLLEGKPGLGKTHLVLALARTFGGNFRRIQFTPDLMPSDVTGHTLFDLSSQTFRVRQGPIFTQLLLADEINRAPAKTQSALLEVMQEGQVTIDGESHPLTPPFMTFATQNPIEQEGTYPLPEAQLDRFLVKVLIDYPDSQQEADIVRSVTAEAGGRGLSPDHLQPICTPADILAAQRETAAVQAVESVVQYAVAITRATRSHGAISLGAGTRGAISLVRIAKAYALLDGRHYITPSDVKSAALPVLRHRVTLAPEVAISGQSTDDVLLSVINQVQAPRS
jgi:MoxR-like ATPase